MKLSQLKIDPEFQSKIPPLQFEEEQQLEQNIIAEGRLLNPIITWNGYILDGHTRYRILKKHGFIKFEVEEIQLANKYEALAWICKNQLGRRNLSPERKKFLLGKEYESTKLAVGGQPGNCNKVNGCERYVEMLRIINEAWKGNVDSYLAGVIRGVARFISVYEGEYSRERLVQQRQGHIRKRSRSWRRKTPEVLQTATCGRFFASITVPAVR